MINALKSKLQTIKTAEYLTEQIRQLELDKYLLEEAINDCNTIYKNLSYYLNLKQEEVLSTLNANLFELRNIITNADLNGIHLSVENNKAELLDGNNRLISKREGGALRSLIDIFIRVTLLKMINPEIKLLVLDEAISTLSDVSIDNFTEILNNIKKEFIVVAIEQRDSSYVNIYDRKVELLKEGNTTKISKYDIRQ